MLGSAHVPAVHRQLTERDEFLADFRDWLEHAQQHYKAQYDTKHREVVFQEGDWVWLRLLHRPVASMDIRGRGKLGSKFYGPFYVLERLGNVAYKHRITELKTEIPHLKMKYLS
jgi:hypothetical protein